MTAPRCTPRALSALGVGGSVAALVLASPLGAAAAGSSEPPIVVNRETVQAELSPGGALDTARLFSQLVVSGNGKVRIADPTSGKNLRDLDGFSAPAVRDGKAQYSIDVNGKATRRTVSDFTGKLPLKITAEYSLDGKRMKAQDVVGKSGVLDVRYTVENVSATPTSISYAVNGKTVTKTVDLVTPYVGQLTLDLPASFTDLDTPRADVAGDGRGGSNLNWTMVLFEPIGQVKQTFGYTAHVKNAQLPAAKIQAVPVSPARHPELAFGEKGFSDGADAAGNVAFAGTAISENLLKLQAGTGQLLDGLTKLAAGATALKAGLAGQAAPGAKQLADGLGQAKAGSTKLAAGADQLGGGLKTAKSGSSKLAAGLGSASAGSEKLVDGSQDLAAGAGLTAAGASTLSAGLTQISGGLDSLAATAGLPTALGGAKALRAGVDKLLAGLGSASDPKTILGGLAQVSGGLGSLSSGISAAKGGVDQVQAGLAASTTASGGITKIKALVDGAMALGACAPGLPVATPATLCQDLNTLEYAMTHPATSAADPGGLIEQTQAAAAGLGLVSAGLGTQALPGIGALATGVGQITAGVTQVQLGLKSGSAANPGIAEGLDSLVAGLTAAVGGVTQLSAGAQSASAGSKALADGTKKVSDGAAQLSAEGAAPLAAGLSQLYSGSKQLDSGLAQLAAGGGQAVAGVHSLDDGLTKLYAGSKDLSSGLDTAATGSGQLADGLNQAKAGGQQIADGTGQLNSQAAQPLVKAGTEQASTYAENYAIMQALDTKGATGALPYGAPEGATGTAGYDFTLAAATSAGADNTRSGVTAIVLLALAGLSGFVVRRRVTG